MKTLADWAPLLEAALDGAIGELADTPERAEQKARAVSAAAKAVTEVLALTQSAAAQTQEEDDELVRAQLRAKLQRLLESDPDRFRSREPDERGEGAPQ